MTRVQKLEGAMPVFEIPKVAAPEVARYTPAATWALQATASLLSPIKVTDAIGMLAAMPEAALQVRPLSRLVQMPDELPPEDDAMRNV